MDLEKNIGDGFDFPQASNPKKIFYDDEKVYNKVLAQSDIDDDKEEQCACLEELGHGLGDENLNDCPDCPDCCEDGQ